MSSFEAISVPATDLRPAVRGFLHTPAQPAGTGVVLTHGAGGNSNSKLLVAIAETFSASGIHVLRCDLPFRQRRPFGPPSPSSSAEDRNGLLHAVDVLKKYVPGRIFLGGHSYGGRQSSILASESTDSRIDGLLLLSYPLHPPGKPLQLRTAHFPSIKIPCVFIQGSRDTFATTAEMEAALLMITAAKFLFIVEGAGHDLKVKTQDERALAQIVFGIFQKHLLQT